MSWVWWVLAASAPLIFVGAAVLGWPAAGWWHDLQDRWM